MSNETVHNETVHNETVPNETVHNETVMWEARAAPGRLADLVEYVLKHAAEPAQIYFSGRGDPRVVVIDPTGVGISDVPAELIARPPHSWPFTRVSRP